MVNTSTVKQPRPDRHAAGQPTSALAARGLDPQVAELGGLPARVAVFALAFGAAGLLIAVVLGERQHDDWKAFFQHYLAHFTYFLSITLGALFFTILQHITRAGWSTVVRRLAETLACNVLPLFILAIPVVIGIDHIYGWAEWHHDHGHDGGHGAGHGGHHAPSEGKKLWLSHGFFIGRLVFYFAAWIFMSRFFYSMSVAQDASGDVGITKRMQKASAPALIVFALTLTFGAFDLLMSIDPHWFSTIFGVYFFAGGNVGFFAVIILTVLFLQKNGILKGAVTTEHFHDLGKLLFAFTCFWAYSAFSQYMLIWYANMPEETEWFQARHHGAWGVAGVCFLIFGHFIAPFVLIMSRRVKRLPNALALACIWMLGVHWFDHYWLVMPRFSEESVPFGSLDLALFLGLGGVWVAGFAWRLQGKAALPIKDPRLGESLDFENF